MTDPPRVERDELLQALGDMELDTDAVQRALELAGEEVGGAVTVSAHKFSRTAREKIEAAGGRCEERG